MSRAVGSVVAVIVLTACQGAVANAAPALDDPSMIATAMSLVSSAENSSLDWRAQYGYVEDIADGRGYTAGIIGFTTGTGDLLDVVREYATRSPGNPLVRFIPALEAANGSDSHAGLGDTFVGAWKSAAEDPEFQAAQDAIRDRYYLRPAVQRGIQDGLGALGQFAYFDALVMHGPGGDWPSFDAIRARAMTLSPTPAVGGDETAYLTAFLDVRVDAMHEEAAHEDTSRIDTAQRRFLREGNLDLVRPLEWDVYGDHYVLE